MPSEVAAGRFQEILLLPGEQPEALAGGGDMTETVDVSPAKARRVRRMMLAAAVVIVVAATCGLLFARRHGGSAPSTTVAVGHTVPFVLRCSGPGAPCAGGLLDANGAQWYWPTPAYSDIPTGWLPRDVSGLLTISADWGDAKFVADGEEMAIVGGLLTPEHRFTTQG
jgi:hypothetical protein